MADVFHTPVAVPSLPTTFSAKCGFGQSIIMCTSLPTIFAEKMWLCPIDHTELKHNINLVQNPGWTNPE